MTKILSSAHRHSTHVFKRPALFALVLLASLAGCGDTAEDAAATPATEQALVDREGPTTRADWCRAVMSEMCDRLTSLCGQNQPEFRRGCVEGGLEECVGGAPNEATGRTFADLRSCVGMMHAPVPSCQGLTQNIAAMSSGLGPYAQCVIGPPSGL